MTKEEYIAGGKKVLTLQIDNRCFHTILDGTQDVETRWIKPHTAPMYVTYIADDVEYKAEHLIPEEAEQVEFVAREYDALYLINGRKEDAPRLMVELEGEEIVFFKEVGDNLYEPIAPDDTESVPAYREENGKGFTVAQIWYYLGNVVFTENLENLK